jgi:hypothetical protein
LDGLRLERWPAPKTIMEPSSRVFILDQSCGGGRIG